jgi:hypothetical protein
MGFNQPGAGAGDKIDLKALHGRLLLVYPKRIENGVKTQGFGEKDPLIADVVILDGPTPGEELLDAFIFPGVLIGQLKKFIGDPNPALGRLVYGEAKPGMNAPWMLAEYDARDEQLATAWVNSHPRTFNQTRNQNNGQQQQPPVQSTALQPGGAVNTSAAPPAAAPPQPPAPSAANVNVQTGEIGAVNVDTVRTLIGLNIADQDIAASTGASPEQIAAIRNLPVG